MFVCLEITKTSNGEVRERHYLSWRKIDFCISECFRHFPFHIIHNIDKIRGSIDTGNCK